MDNPMCTCGHLRSVHTKRVEGWLSVQMWCEESYKVDDGCTCREFEEEEHSEVRLDTVQYIDIDEGRQVVVNGWLIPGLRAHVSAAEECIYLRYGARTIDLPFELADRIVEFVAEAITVATGHGGLPMDNGIALAVVNPAAPHPMKVGELK